MVQGSIAAFHDLIGYHSAAGSWIAILILENERLGDKT